MSSLAKSGTLLSFAAFSLLAVFESPARAQGGGLKLKGPPYANQHLSHDLEWRGSLVMADLHGSGERVIIAAGHGIAGSEVHALHADGSAAAGWPHLPATAASIEAGVSVGDLNRNGQREVVFTTGEWDVSGAVHAVDAHGQSLPGWPVYLNLGHHRQPALADMTGDGALEVIVAGAAWQGPYRLHVLDSAGRDVGPSPVNLQASPASDPALGNLRASSADTGAGAPEVVLALEGGLLMAFDATGQILPGWPVEHSGTSGPPLCVDLDSDGFDEVVIPRDYGLDAFHGDGTRVSGWPVFTGPSATARLATGDLDGDGAPEIAMACGGGNLHVFRADGSYLPGFPVPAGVAVVDNGPLLGDLDGDGSLDILLATVEAGVLAWQRDGSPKHGFPLPLDGTRALRPCFEDLDNDGRLDLAAAAATPGPNPHGELRTWRGGRLSFNPSAAAHPFPADQGGLYHGGRAGQTPPPLVPVTLSTEGPPRARINGRIGCRYTITNRTQEPVSISALLGIQPVNHPTDPWYTLWGEVFDVPAETTLPLVFGNQLPLDLSPGTYSLDGIISSSVLPFVLDMDSSAVELVN